MSAEVPIEPVLERLPPGQHKLSREEVAENQQIRLRQAMVACVAKHGYANTKLRDLAREAGVSPNVFYNHYADKQECFLAAHDRLAHVALERVEHAIEDQPDWRAASRAATAAFIDVVISAPAAAYLALVEINAVGALALEHQQRALAAHERVVRSILDRAPHGATIPDTTVKGIVAGTRAVVAHQLAEGHPGELRSYIEPICGWAESYDAALPAPLAEPFPRALRRPARLPAVPSGAAGARVLGHRERIMRAVAQIACEQGYAGLRMPAIAARAGVSNQTFYEHFANKHEAFLACYDRAGRRGLAAVLGSFQGADDWPHAVRASLQTLLEHISREPEFARLCIFEILAAGPDARRRAEDRATALTAMLTPGAPQAKSGAPPRIFGALVAGGAWGVISHHILHGRTRRLAELTPQLTYLALTPFIGAGQAYRVALGG